MRLNIPLLVCIGFLTLVTVPLVKGSQKAIPFITIAEPPIGTQTLEPLYEKPIVLFSRRGRRARISPKMETLSTEAEK